MKTEDLAIPTIHLNGTGKQELFDQIRQAYEAIREAKAKLANATPHGRDYYVQPPNAYEALKRALEQHRARITKLNEIEDELLRIYIGIDMQGDKNAR